MLIYGINAVTEALKAGRVVSMRAGRRNDQRLQQLLALAEQASVPVRRVSDDELDRESGGSSHQGVDRRRERAEDVRAPRSDRRAQADTAGARSSCSTASKIRITSARFFARAMRSARTASCGRRVIRRR